MVDQAWWADDSAWLPGEQGGFDGSCLQEVSHSSGNRP